MLRVSFSKLEKETSILSRNWRNSPLEKDEYLGCRRRSQPLLTGLGRTTTTTISSIVPTKGLGK